MEQTYLHTTGSLPNAQGELRLTSIHCGSYNNSVMQKYYFSQVFFGCILCLCVFFSTLSCTNKTLVETAPSVIPEQTPSNSATPIVKASPAASSILPTASPTSPTAKPTVAPVASPIATIQPIQVSKEVFTQTFNQVEQLINNLNDIIKQRDYLAWTTHLSETYKNRFSQAEYLETLTQSATLQKNNIVLRTMQDYFTYVVVPSRASLRLDDLVFLSETEVEAIMVVGNRRVTLYRLIKIGDQWMIGPS